MHIESPGCIRPGRRPHIGSWDNISSVSPSGNPSGKHSGYSGRSFRVENCHSAGANVARNPEHACALFPLSCIDFSACLICHRRTNGRPEFLPEKGTAFRKLRGSMPPGPPAAERAPHRTNGRQPAGGGPTSQLFDPQAKRRNRLKGPSRGGRSRLGAIATIRFRGNCPEPGAFRAGRDGDRHGAGRD